MKAAVYPGSFNPWHEGHADVLRKALQIFDRVFVLVGFNPEKGSGLQYNLDKLYAEYQLKGFNDERVVVKHFSGLLVDAIKNLKVDAVIRGLRNGHDLQYEMNQQYWNEDLGLTIPIVHFICDRKYLHISSTYVRMIDQFKLRERTNAPGGSDGEGG